MEAIKSPSPAIGFINQDAPIKAAAILTILLVDLAKSFNIGKTMNATQVAEVVKEILKDESLRSFKPEDFKLCFDRMKKGYYGINYDRIDMQTIFVPLYEYLNERTSIVEQINNDRHEAYKLGKMAPANPEGMKKLCEMLKSAVKHVPKPDQKEIDKELKQRPTIKKSERDLFIQSCFMEFEKMDKVDNAGRFVMFEGKEVDATEYVEIRLKEYDQNK